MLTKSQVRNCLLVLSAPLPDMSFAFPQADLTQVRVQTSKGSPLQNVLRAFLSTSPQTLALPLMRCRRTAVVGCPVSHSNSPAGFMAVYNVGLIQKERRNNNDFNAIRRGSGIRTRDLA
jgi:hypothetical protein